MKTEGVILMLSTPNVGWSRITIGEWSDRCSYLDDVPFMLLEAIEESCRINKPVSVKLDAEGWEDIIIFDQFETHIISNLTDTFIHYSVDIDRDELAKELTSDIRRDIDGWCKWFCYQDLTEDYISERKKDLLALCDIIEKRIN